MTDALTPSAPIRLPLHLGHDLRAAEPEDDAVLREYLALKLLVAEAEERLEALKPRLTALVLDQPEDDGKGRCAHAYGFELSVHYRRTYAYSLHVAELAEQLKAAKKYEETHGVAVVTKHQAVLVARALKA